MPLARSISPITVFPYCLKSISSTWEIAVTNDTPVFNAMLLDPDSGEKHWDGKLGTREAIKRDGMQVDAASLSYCPHEWINGAGYVDLNLVRRFPRMLAL